MPWSAAWLPELGRKIVVVKKVSKAGLSSIFCSASTFLSLREQKEE
tara:strand:+ start:322 stop:459 length:138 start_codon:yes stop_codon:yes gene_type:complete